MRFDADDHAAVYHFLYFKLFQPNRRKADVIVFYYFSSTRYYITAVIRKQMILDYHYYADLSLSYACLIETLGDEFNVHYIGPN